MPRKVPKGTCCQYGFVIAKALGGKGLRKMMRTEKLSFYQPNRQPKLEMFQQEVEELFFFQTGVPSLLRHGGR